MINKLKNLRSNTREEGFTLIELMIVVVIIGILAAIAIPIFMNQQKGAIGGGLKSDVKNTVTEVATILAKNPTAQNLSGVVTPVVSDDGTVITVDGSWDNYTVRGVNMNSDPTCWEFVSVTGKSGNCSDNPTTPPSDDNDTPPVGGGVLANDLARDLSVQYTTCLQGVPSAYHTANAMMSEYSYKADCNTAIGFTTTWNGSMWAMTTFQQNTSDGFVRSPSSSVTNGVLGDGCVSAYVPADSLMTTWCNGSVSYTAPFTPPPVGMG